ncbi:MAG: GC-type dockerin domain-anchored protein [Planctomycetota bacterium]|nr:GC-type dockerin domain-anchored protein [Planctomycetota bacterium]
MKRSDVVLSWWSWTVPGRSGSAPRPVAARLALAAGIGVAAAGVSSAAAQPFFWTNPAGGNWHEAANWNPRQVPSGPVADAFIELPGTYTITSNSSVQLGNLELRAPLAVLRATAPLNLALGATIDGRLELGNGSTSAVLQPRVSSPIGIVLAGSGRIFLNGTGAPGSEIRGDAAGFVIGSELEVTGSGLIRGRIRNDGLILANLPGRELEYLPLVPGINNGVLGAGVSSTLRLGPGAIISQGAPEGGLIEAVGGGTVLVEPGAVITGGQIATREDGRVRFLSGGSCTLDAVQLRGSFRGAPSGSLNFRNNPRLDGTLTIPDEPGPFILNVASSGQTSGVLGGSGQLVLAAPANQAASVLVQGLGAPFSIGPGFTVVGSGRVAGIAINDGEVRASIEGQRLEVIPSSTLTNRGVLAAGVGATLGLEGPIVQSTSGVTRTEGGTIELPLTLAGGRLETTGSGVVVVPEGRQPAVGNIATDGAINITRGREIVITRPTDGTLNPTWLGVEGVIQIGTPPPGGGASNSARLRAGSNPSVLITGMGEIVLLPTSDQLAPPNELRLEGPEVTLAPGLLVHGSGAIGGRIRNAATIDADVPGRLLTFINAGDCINENVIRASNEGILRVPQIAITQATSARVEAVGGGRVELQAARLTSGVLRAREGGQVSVVGPGTTELRDVTIDGGATIASGARANVVNTGRTRLLGGDVRVEGITPTGAAAFLSIRGAETGPVFVVTGEATIRLLGDDTSSDAQPVLEVVGNQVLGPGIRIEGRGALRGTVTLAGTLAPGSEADPFGVIRQLGARVSLAEGSTHRVSIARDGDALLSDELQAPVGTVSLAGNLVLEPVGNYRPRLGDRVVLVQGLVEGRYARIEGANPGEGRLWRVFYGDASVQAIVTCRADATGDGQIDLFDYLQFVESFGDGRLEADIDGNGQVDLFDYLAFAQALGEPCE